MGNTRRKKTILVLYYTRGVYPLRNTIETHLYCWKEYSKHNVVYVNIAFGFPEKLLNYLKIDIIIFHTIFLSMRWSQPIFDKFTAMVLPLAKIKCPKIALPQDEFIHTNMLVSFLDKIGVTHIGTCVKESEWEKVYKPLMKNKVKLFTVLTGYLDRKTITRVIELPEVDRTIDIGYRAWRAQYWLGEHGMHKVWVAENFKKACKNKSLKLDISLRDEDTFSGFEWFKFLKKCKVTIGVEGGASILDHSGEIKKSVDSYIQKHPQASFTEVREACFPHQDNTFGLACISPRHLEACLTKTCQILIEGEFNGILRAGVDYIPLKKDYSNIKEVIELTMDPLYIQKITENAFKHVLSSSLYYDDFVKAIEKIAMENESRPRNLLAQLKQSMLIYTFKIRDFLTWLYINLEVKALSNQTQKFFAKILRYLSKVVKPASC